MRKELVILEEEEREERLSLAKRVCPQPTSTRGLLASLFTPAAATPAAATPVAATPIPISSAFNITPKKALAFIAGIAGVALVLAASGALAGLSLSLPFLMAVVAAAVISVATVSVGYAFFSRNSEKTATSLSAAVLS